MTTIRAFADAKRDFPALVQDLHAVHERIAHNGATLLRPYLSGPHNSTVERTAQKLTSLKHERIPEAERVRMALDEVMGATTHRHARTLLAETQAFADAFDRRTAATASLMQSIQATVETRVEGGYERSELIHAHGELIRIRERARDLCSRVSGAAEHVMLMQAKRRANIRSLFASTPQTIRRVSVGDGNEAILHIGYEPSSIHATHARVHEAAQARLGRSDADALLSEDFALRLRGMDPTAVAKILLEETAAAAADSIREHPSVVPSARSHVAIILTHDAAPLRLPKHMDFAVPIAIGSELSEALAAGRYDAIRSAVAAQVLSELAMRNALGREHDARQRSLLRETLGREPGPLALELLTDLTAARSRGLAQLTEALAVRSYPLVVDLEPARESLRALANIFDSIAQAAKENPGAVAAILHRPETRTLITQSELGTALALAQVFGRLPERLIVVQDGSIPNVGETFARNGLGREHPEWTAADLSTPGHLRGIILASDEDVAFRSLRALTMLDTIPFVEQGQRAITALHGTAGADIGAIVRTLSPSHSSSQTKQ